MRTRFWLARDAVLLWLAGMVSPAYAVLVALELVRPGDPVTVWEGATAGWSPMAAVAVVGGPSGWDVDGWRQGADRELHRALDRVEHQLWSDLDALLAEVYAWRDQ